MRPEPAFFGNGSAAAGLLLLAPRLVVAGTSYCVPGLVRCGFHAGAGLSFLDLAAVLSCGCCCCCFRVTTWTTAWASGAVSIFAFFAFFFLLLLVAGPFEGALPHGFDSWGVVVVAVLVVVAAVVVNLAVLIRSLRSLRRRSCLIFLSMFPSLPCSVARSKPLWIRCPSFARAAGEISGITGGAPSLDGSAMATATLGAVSRSIVWACESEKQKSMAPSPRVPHRRFSCLCQVGCRVVSIEPRG